MLVAIASGKGGTGKTMVAVNLTVALRARGRVVQLLDCDVEEPNCDLLLHPVIERRSAVTVSVPTVDRSKCDLCGMCAQLCAFGAIARLKDDIAVFPELCHACGGCAVVCPRNAISETPREVGRLDLGHVDGIGFAGGTLHVGEARATPVIAAVKERIDPDALAIIDAPPGTSCPVVESVRGADYVLLVCEPTPFGLHDLTLVCAMLAELGRPAGLVISRVGMGDERVHRFAAERRLPVLAEIPDSREAARQQARGRLVYRAVPELAAVFDQLAARLEEQVQPCAS